MTRLHQEVCIEVHPAGLNQAFTDFGWNKGNFTLALEDPHRRLLYCSSFPAPCSILLLLSAGYAPVRPAPDMNT